MLESISSQRFWTWVLIYFDQTQPKLDLIRPQTWLRPTGQTRDLVKPDLRLDFDLLRPDLRLNLTFSTLEYFRNAALVIPNSLFWNKMIYVTFPQNDVVHRNYIFCPQTNCCSFKSPKNGKKIIKTRDEGEQFKERSRLGLGKACLGHMTHRETLDSGLWRPTGECGQNELVVLCIMKGAWGQPHSLATTIKRSTKYITYKTRSCRCFFS